MKHLLTIAATAILACGMTGVRASAGDFGGCGGCDTGCDPCGKKWFGGGLFNKGCGCNDPCAKRLSLPKLNFFNKGCGCDNGCGQVDNCNTCNTCDNGCGHKWFGGGLFNKGCKDPCAKRLSLPKLNLFKRGCGCDDGCNTGCGGCGGTVIGAPVGGPIVQPVPVQAAPVPAPAPVPAAK